MSDNGSNSTSSADSLNAVEAQTATAPAVQPPSLEERITAVENAVFGAAPAVASAAEGATAAVAPSSTVPQRIADVEDWLETHKSTIEALTALGEEFAAKGFSGGVAGMLGTLVTHIGGIL